MIFAVLEIALPKAIMAYIKRDASQMFTMKITRIFYQRSFQQR